MDWTEGEARIAIWADIYGPLAVHREVRLQDEPAGDLAWRVTHCATGMCFPLRFDSRAQAKLAAERIFLDMGLDFTDGKQLVGRSLKAWERLKRELGRAPIRAHAEATY